MSKRVIVGTTVLAGTAMLLSAGLAAQDMGMEPGEQEFNVQEVNAQEKAWMEYSTPGREHQHLAKMVGTWDVSVKFWMAPAMEPVESPATAEYLSILDGRYLIEKVEGDFMGQPFEGMGIVGYDNLTKEFVAVWVDNMMTGILNYQGERDPLNRNIVRYTGEHPDPMRGEYVTSRSTQSWIDDDTVKHEAFSLDEEGEEFKHMELVYTRR